MRVLLLQDHIYLPSYGGGIKANRMLLEGLARRGHACAAVTPAFTSAAGPSGEAAFRQEMKRRHIDFHQPEPSTFSYVFRGVEVDALCSSDRQEMQTKIQRRLHEFDPDWVLINDDKLRLLLESALSATSAARIVLVLQTISNMPFGPFSVLPSSQQTQRMREARAIVTISAFLQDYLARYAQLSSAVVPLPVYGERPVACANPADRRFVTMLNPCIEKGVDIFLALARELQHVQFAAIRGWGTSMDLLATLAELPNVCVFEPADELDEVLEQTRVLLAPSLWPETFGYIVPEAMLRGIPVLASDNGGLREAALGVAMLLPVSPISRKDGRYVAEAQDTRPWSLALRHLLDDAEEYDRHSRAARQAALAFVSSAGADRFESFLAGLDARA